MRYSTYDLGKVFQLIATDLRRSLGKIWAAAAVLAGLYLAYWVIMLMIGTATAPSDRISILYFAAQFFSFCVPAAVYGYINNPNDGIGYALLPLKRWVKFTAMISVSVLIIPLTFYTGLYIMDCLLTAAGGGRGFSGMIWSTDGGITVSGWLADFGKICMYQSVFVLGNILLKKHKTAITFLAMLLLHGIFIGLFQADEIQGRLVQVLYAYILPALIWALAYFCLGKIQYR